MTGSAKKFGSQDGFLSFLRQLMSIGLPLMKNVITQFSQSILVPGGLTAAASAKYAAIKINK